MLCVLKLGCWKQPQNVVKFAILFISVAEPIWRLGFVDNCIFLLFYIGILWCFGFLPVTMANNMFNMKGLWGVLFPKHQPLQSIFPNPSRSTILPPGFVTTTHKVCHIGHLRATCFSLFSCSNTQKTKLGVLAVWGFLTYLYFTSEYIQVYNLCKYK